MLWSHNPCCCVVVSWCVVVSSLCMVGWSDQGIPHPVAGTDGAAKDAPDISTFALRSSVQPHNLQHINLHRDALEFEDVADPDAATDEQQVMPSEGQHAAMYTEKNKRTKSAEKVVKPEEESAMARRRNLIRGIGSEMESALEDPQSDNNQTDSKMDHIIPMGSPLDKSNHHNNNNNNKGQKSTGKNKIHKNIGPANSAAIFVAAYNKQKQFIQAKKQVHGIHHAAVVTPEEKPSNRNPEMIPTPTLQEEEAARRSINETQGETVIEIVTSKSHSGGDGQSDSSKRNAAVGVTATDTNSGSQDTENAASRSKPGYVAEKIASVKDQQHQTKSSANLTVPNESAPLQAHTPVALAPRPALALASALAPALQPSLALAPAPASQPELATQQAPQPAPQPAPVQAPATPIQLQTIISSKKLTSSAEDAELQTLVKEARSTKAQIDKLTTLINEEDAAASNKTIRNEVHKPQTQVEKLEEQLNVEKEVRQQLVQHLVEAQVDDAGREEALEAILRHFSPPAADIKLWNLSRRAIKSIIRARKGNQQRMVMSLMKRRRKGGNNKKVTKGVA